ncbi:MAG: phosphatase PAP2 family protein [Cyanobacteria bacterium RUI128]|nr:phosphatase PAP2 family protein [Cyanobacteria bacterium RUI128]
MEYGAWLGWQIDYLLFLQNFRDVSNHIFDKFFLTITMFGEVTIPIMVICLLYWAISKKAGQLVLWSYLFGFVVNQFAKVTACIYRPWILDPRVHPLAQAIPAATGYSFPSGHTAGAVAVWGGIAVSFWKNKIVRYLGLLIIAGVMISRNYVGVHTPQDVIVSFFLSSLVLYVSWKALKWSEEDSKRDKYVLFTILGLTILTVLYVCFKPYPIHYLFGQILYDPTPIKYDTIGKSGFVAGAFLGWFIEKRFIDFKPEIGTFSQKVARMLVGLTVVYALYSGFEMFKDMIGTNLIFALSGMFCQTLLIGLFITCIYPFFIKKFQG